MIEFGLLGPMTAVRDERDVLPSAGKQRVLLARLLLQRNDAVPAGQLVEAVWADGAPPTAEKMLQGHVSALRKLLGTERIETRTPGYVLHASEDELDLCRFERLLAAARAATEPARRAELAQEAL